MCIGSRVVWNNYRRYKMKHCIFFQTGVVDGRCFAYCSKKRNKADIFYCSECSDQVPETASQPFCHGECSSEKIPILSI